MLYVDDEQRMRFGKLLKQQRISLSLTLMDLADKSGISASHLGRIERGERFPSGHVLRKIAKPLGFNESELLTLAGYFTATDGSPRTDNLVTTYGGGHLDADIARFLAHEPLEVQRAVIGILSILKILQGWRGGGSEWTSFRPV